MPIKHLFYITLLLFIPLITCSQESNINGRVINKKSSAPVPFATIFLLGKNGVVSNQSGYFQLNKSTISENDTIEIRSLGYYSIKIPMKDVIIESNKPTIFRLPPKVERIKEVVVYPKKDSTIRLGPIRNNKKCNLSFIVNKINLPFQVATFLKPKKKCKLKSVSFFITKKYKEKTKFRVQLYEKDSISGLPGKPLLTENVFGQAKKGNKWVDIPLQKYNITVSPEGFFVAMEIIFIDNKGIHKQKVSFENGDKKIIENYGARVAQCLENKINGYSTYIFSYITQKWDKINYNRNDSTQSYYPLIKADVIY